MSPSRPMRPVPRSLPRLSGFGRTVSLVSALAGCLVVLAGCATQQAGPPAAGPAVPADAASGFTFLGEALIPKAPPAGIEPIGAHAAPVGGLSGLVFDPASGHYLALSDSRGERGPVRVYTLEIDLRAGAGGQAPELLANGVRVLAVTHLLDRGGVPFAEGTVDPEGIALAPGGGGFYVSSEGVAEDGIAPFVRRFAADGTMLRGLPVPDAYLPGSGVQPHGVRNNLGFEPLSLAPPTADGTDYLFSGTENALAQDGPEATVEHGSRSRLLRWTLTADGTATGAPDEWVYPVAPVAQAPGPANPQPEGLPVNGLVELLALGPDRLLALERSYTDGVGTTVRLYRVRLDDATAVTGRASLADGSRSLPVEKTLLLDVSHALTAHGVPTDNLEGMTFGPDLPDGRRLLLMVSDDNFSCDQRTQVVAFAVAPSAL